MAIMFPALNPPQPVKAVTPYPPPGSKVWALSEHISSSGSDYPHGVAVDGSGVYVVGGDENTAGNHYEWRVEKRSLTTGVIIWAVSEHISSYNDWAYGVAVDGSGLYAVGFDHNGAGNTFEWRVEKRSLTTGVIIWAMSEDISTGSSYAYGVAVDGSGVYVVGYDSNTAGTNSEWRVEKRSLTTGVIMWAVSEDISTIWDAAYGVAVDASGVYVVGFDQVPGNYEWRVEKRSLTTGVIIWAMSEDISTSYDTAYGVAVDGSGVYVVGSDENTAGNKREWRVEKRSLTTGVLVWFESEWISSGVNGDDVASGVAVHGSGVYVVGGDENTVGNKPEWRVEKRSLTTGVIMWAVSEPISTSIDWASGVAVDGSGVYVVGGDENTAGNHDEWRVERRSKPQGDLVPAAGVGTLGFTVNNGSLWSLAGKTPSSVSPLPAAGLTFPYGLFNFTVGNLTAGASVNVTVTLPAPLPNGPVLMYWTFHNGVWRQLPSSHFMVAANRSLFMLNLTDGVASDDRDETANGVIVDVGGVAYAYNVTLGAGWNLISLPVVPVDPTAASMFRSLAASGNLGLVWGFTGTPRSWKFYLPGKVSTLTTMNDGYGYEVYMRSADTLYVNGSAIPFGSTPPSYPLVAGWNLVGFKSQPNATEPRTVGAYLMSINGSYDHASAWVYNNTRGMWIRADTNPITGTVLRPGDAMWVLMTTPATLRP